MAYTILGEKISALLKRQGLSQKELSVRTGINEAVISRHVRGKTKPQTKNLRKIADALGITVDDLTGNVTDAICYDAYKTLISIVKQNAALLTLEQKMEVINILFSNV